MRETDVSYYFRWYGKNGIITQIPDRSLTYTPKEWIDNLLDVNEIRESVSYYGDSFYAPCFIRYIYAKRKKYYIEKTIRIHRKKLCLFIAKNPELKIYEGTQLEEYKEKLEELVYKTFEYQTRSVSFRNLNISGRCLNCSLILSETNRNSWRYCSQDCKDEFYLNYQFSYSRDWVWERDKGICQICKKSTRFVVESIHNLWHVNSYTKKVECDIVMISLIEDDRVIKFKRTKSAIGKIYYLPYKITIEEYDVYEIDHIIEVASGKTPKEQVKLFIDYNNLQTVCKPCHKKKTAKFLRKRFKKNQTKSKAINEFIKESK